MRQRRKYFYVAYTLDGAAKRPITFVFNGGPGSASALLHLGGLGPRVVNFLENGSAPVQPVQLSDNPDSWLAFTDLVFIDPAGTGYSRPTASGDEAERAFWGVDKDTDSLAAFIALYLARNERELAPLFLAGESYGGFRASYLSDRILQMGYNLKGAVLISPALEFSMLRGGKYTLLPEALSLPSLAAAHAEMVNGPNADLEPVRKAEIFARTAYLLHLAAGLQHDEAIIADLSRYTGLDAELISRHHGRVSLSLFVREYQRRNDRTLCLYDATVSVPLPKPADDEAFDPLFEGIALVLRPAMTQYVRQELGYRTDLPYLLRNRNATSNWDYGFRPGEQGLAGSLDRLERARTRYPGLKILIAHGYTDLVTPYSVSQFLISQLRPIDTAAPIALKVYRGGHMMYFRPASRRQLKDDARELYAAALTAP